MDERERMRRELGAQNRERVKRRRHKPKGALAPPPSTQKSRDPMTVLGSAGPHDSGAEAVDRDQPRRRKRRRTETDAAFALAWELAEIANDDSLWGPPKEPDVIPEAEWEELTPGEAAGPPPIS